jgi:hypothetical protein
MKNSLLRVYWNALNSLIISLESDSMLIQVAKNKVVDQKYLEQLDILCKKNLTV